MEDYRLRPEHRKDKNGNYRNQYTDNSEPLKDPRDNEVKTHIYYQPDTWGLTSTKRKFTGILALKGAEVQELGAKPSISSDGTPCITTLPEPAPKVDKWEWYYNLEKMQYVLRMENGEEYVFTHEYLTRMGRYIHIAVFDKKDQWASVYDATSPTAPLNIKQVEVENPIYTRQRYRTEQTHNDSDYSYSDIYENFKRAQEELEKEERLKREQDRYHEELKKMFRTWGPDDFNRFYGGSGA